MIAVPMVADRHLRTFFIGAGKSELRMIKRRFLLGAVSLLVVNQLVVLDTNHRQGRELLIKTRDLTGQVNLLNYLKDQLDVINASREKLVDLNQQLATSLASLPEARPVIQQYVQDNQADLQAMDAKFAYLNTWLAGWQGKLVRAADSTEMSDRGRFQFVALQEQRDLDKKMAAQCNYVFEYTIASLRASLAEQARQLGENLISTCNGLPSSLQTNQVDLGTFSLGDRPSSYFYLSLKKGTGEYDPNCLSITCEESGMQMPAVALASTSPQEARVLAGAGKVLYTLNIQPDPDKIIATFQAPGGPAVSETFAPADYGRGVTAALSRLFSPQMVKNTIPHSGSWN